MIKKNLNIKNFKNLVIVSGWSSVSLLFGCSESNPTETVMACPRDYQLYAYDLTVNQQAKANVPNLSYKLGWETANAKDSRPCRQIELGEYTFIRYTDNPVYGKGDGNYALIELPNNDRVWIFKKFKK